MATGVYSWDYLRRLARWSIPVGVLTAAVGALLTKDMRFAVACGAVTAVDIAIFQLIVSRAEAMLAGSGPAGAGAVAALMGIRLVFKAAVLVGAALAPALAPFAAVVAGALVVDTTIMVVGGVTAVVHGLRGTGPLGGGG